LEGWSVLKGEEAVMGEFTIMMSAVIFCRATYYRYFFFGTPFSPRCAIDSPVLYLFFSSHPIPPTRAIMIVICCLFEEKKKRWERDGWCT
jgi:hypothetical protein